MLKVYERITNADELDLENEEEVAVHRVDDMYEEYGEIKIPQSWKKPPRLKDLQHDIDYALVDHDKIVDEIDTHLAYYHTTPGIGRPKKVKGRSNAQPQSIRKAAEWRYAALSEPFLDSPNLFKGSPTTYNDIEGTKQSALVLNYQFRNQIDIVDFIDNFIKDLVDTGTGIIRTSWDMEEISREVTQDIVEYVEVPELEPLYAQLAELMKQDPVAFEKGVPPEIQLAFKKSLEVGIPLQRVLKGTEKVKIKERIKNQPCVEICDYRDVIPDPTCKGKQEKMKFCGFRIRTSKAELAKDPRYTNVDKIVVNLGSNLAQKSSQPGVEETNQDSDTFQFKDPNRQPIEGIEYWGFVDVDGTGVLTPVVFTWFGDVLVRAEENPYPDKKIPFTFVAYLKKRKSLYGEPDGALIYEDQKISGAIIRGVIDILAKNANGQRGIPKGALDYSNLTLFREGKDYEFNPSALQSRDGNIAHITKFPEIPQSALAIQQMAEMNIKEMTGNLPGQPSENHGNSLGTQLEQAQQAGMSKAARRELGILRRISKGIIQVGYKICEMNKEFLEDEEIIRITDESFIAVKKADLDCRYDLSLSISTAEDDAVKAQELSFMVQTSAGVLDAGFLRLLLADIADLRRMPDKAKLYREYQPQPDPIAQQKAQLEIEVLKAEIAEINSRIQENMAEADREKANAEKMRAEARLAQSKADAIDLKYVEDDQGLTHQRELEKAKAQARGNMELESHKKALDMAEKDTDRENKMIDDLLNPSKQPIQSELDLGNDLTDRSNIGTTNASPEPEPFSDEDYENVFQSPESFVNDLTNLGNTEDLLGES